ncbi:MAG: 3'-5' exonuclease domain-containing protein 2 [Bacteroidaceae bacterium]|nr:3'-5' exonuclease domain-containing protein 2 [Bacteroidaceae bacterium]
MTTIYNKYDKKLIADLPRELFQGRIIVIHTAGEAKRAVDYLLRFPRLGIDTETRPNFRPGGMNPVALLQVSTPDTCFLFRLNIIGLTSDILRMLTSRDVLLIGLSLHDDWAQLRRRVDFKPGNFVDLQDYAKKIGIEDMGLQKLYANIFHKKISKGQQLTNWEADVLTEAQKGYAATDAWACLQLYDEITRMSRERDFILVKEQMAEE